MVAALRRRELRPPACEAGDSTAGAAPPAAAPDDDGAVVATRAVPAALTALRADPGRTSLASVREELARLAAVRALALPENLFAEARPHGLALYRQRVAVEAPYELRRHPDPARLTWLAAYAHLRGLALTDGLVDLLIETVHAIGARADRKAERELLDDLKRVTGKQSLLFQVADAALARAGWAPGTPVLVSAEGVLMYLGPAAVARVFRVLEEDGSPMVRVGWGPRVFDATYRALSGGRRFYALVRAEVRPRGS